MKLFDWDAPAPYRVAFSTRLGGVSEGVFASANLGLKTDDDPERVLENRRRLCEAVGADGARADLPLQVHGPVVRRADPQGIVTSIAREPGDGLWSDRPGEAVLVLTADCLPVAVCRAENVPAIVVLHVGWRGLLAGVVEAGARALGGDRLAAAVGPGIGPCCYQVGEEVAGPYRERFAPEVVQDGRLDLRLATDRALRKAGVDAVEHLDHCTACEPELFFSHRRDRGRTGRQGVIGYVR